MPATTPQAVPAIPVTPGNQFTRIQQIGSNQGTAASGNLIFPSDLGRNNFPYWMSLSFYEYTRPSFTGTESMILNDVGTIRLPLPNAMQDQMDVVYEQEKLGTAIGGALASVPSVNKFASGLNAVGGAIGGAYSTAGAGALQFAGVAANPFLTVMFKQPSFKKHSFTWKLAPSNADESQRLNAIINTLRYNQLPDAALGGLLLTYPNICKISVSTSNPETFTYNFKPAVIESLSINFSPAGQASFFGSTRAPTQVEIRINFLEIEFWLQRDYGAASTAGNRLGQNIADAATAITRALGI
jgi:hypothetical protein